MKPGHKKNQSSMDSNKGDKTNKNDNHKPTLPFSSQGIKQVLADVRDRGIEMHSITSQLEQVRL